MRIWLYVGEFGLSIDRALASTAILLVAAALVAFAATTLRGRSAQFAPVALCCIVGWVVLLNVVNLEARVVDVNMNRAAHGQSFDTKYHAELSADALPALRRGAPGLSAADCRKLEVELKEVWRKRLAGDARDWRSWNVPRRGLEERLREPVVCGGAMP